MLKDKLVEKFGNEGIRHSCVNLEDGEKSLRELLEKLQPIKTIIEIGTYQGVSSAILSEYAKKVFSIDVIFLPLRMKIHRHLKLDNVWCHLVKTDAQKKEYIEELFEAEKVDLCFIDGEHFKGQPAYDFELCKNCANILFHDYSPSFPEVYDLCNSLDGYDKEISGSFCLATKKTGLFGKTISKMPKKKRGRRGKQRKERI